MSKNDVQYYSPTNYLIIIPSEIVQEIKLDQKPTESKYQNLSSAKFKTTITDRAINTKKFL